jgi:hypothetical protein
MDRRCEVEDRSTWRRVAAWTLAALSCAWLAGPASASPRGSVIVDIPGADAVLYEVNENMYLIDDDGNVVLPQSATRRQAEASLYGWARLGTLLCPTAFLVSDPRKETCTVTAAGVDDLSLQTGMGGVSGTYAVVLQDDNAADAPEYVVMNGAFRGYMDLSMRPLGKITGTFTPNGSPYAARFCGTIRLPFALNARGKREMPKRNGSAYYLADDYQTLISVQRAETSLGLATVRFELNFDRNCR